MMKLLVITVLISLVACSRAVPNKRSAILKVLADMILKKQNELDQSTGTLDDDILGNIEKPRDNEVNFHMNENLLDDLSIGGDLDEVSSTEPTFPQTSPQTFPQTNVPSPESISTQPPVETTKVAATQPPTEPATIQSSTAFSPTSYQDLLDMINDLKGSAEAAIGQLLYKVEKLEKNIKSLGNEIRKLKSKKRPQNPWSSLLQQYLQYKNKRSNYN